MNLIDSDSYKVSHWQQYPPDTQYLAAYFEAREGAKYEDIVFFGLQPILDRLHGQHDIRIEWMRDVLTKHGLPFNEAGWVHLRDDHKGLLPLRIWALPEGTIARPGEPLIFVKNTCPQCYWLVTWVETMLVRSWYPITVASQSRDLRKMFHRVWELTSDSPLETLDFKLHDFGSRGVSSAESAGIGGMAHLLNFKGTDTLQALYYAQHYYNADVAGSSIPASEHSTVTSWGRENEGEFLDNLLDKNKGGMAAFVIDSYDMYAALDLVIAQADRIIMDGTTLVLRPDSGDPLEIPVNVLQYMEEHIGTRRNSKGYRVLMDNFRVIQGDGMKPDTLKQLVENVVNEGYSIDNIAFGMGSGLLQEVTRDTLAMAYKVCGILRGGGSVWTDVHKDPMTDTGKRSKSLSEVRPYTYTMDLVFNDGVAYSELPNENYQWDDVVRRAKYLGE